MCTSPIRIKNKSSKLGIGSPLYYTVPCGHCQECQDKKSSEFAQRAAQEYYDCVNSGGFVYFETLTYDNENLPIIKVGNQKVPCFNSKHITNFFKSLRIQLERHGYPINKIVNGKKVSLLRYILTSEYGSRFHRPHYHILFFCNIPNLHVSDLWFHIRGGQYFHNRKIVNCLGSWKYGFNNHPCQVKSNVLHNPKRASYVCKYVCKEVGYIKQVSLLKGFDKVSDENKLKLINFHRQSINFGLSLNNKFDEDLYIKTNKIKGYRPDKADGLVPLPKYNYNKLFKERIKDDFSASGFHWEYNDYAKSILTIKQEQDIMNEMFRIYNWSKNEYHYRHNIVKCNISQLLQDNNVNLRKLAIYKLFQKDRILPIEEVNDYSYVLNYGGCDNRWYHAYNEEEIEFLNSIKSNLYINPLYDHILRLVEVAQNEKNKLKQNFDEYKHTIQNYHKNKS